MNCRPYGSKTTIAFWTLIAVADAVMLVAAAGPVLVLLVLAGVALLAGAAVAVRLLIRARAPQARLVPQPRLADARPAPAHLVTRRSLRATEVVARRRA